MDIVQIGWRGAWNVLMNIIQRIQRHRSRHVHNPDRAVDKKVKGKLSSESYTHDTMLAKVKYCDTYLGEARMLGRLSWGSALNPPKGWRGRLDLLCDPCLLKESFLRHIEGSHGGDQCTSRR